MNGTHRLTGFLAICLVALANIGCAATSVNVAQSSTVKPATPDQVASCTYIDDVVGTSGWYGMFASQGSENARQELLLKSEKLGATHVVWQQAGLGYGSTSATAKAYRCASR